MVDQQLDAGHGFERRLAGDHPVRHSAQVVDVGPAIDLAAAVDRFGREVARRPEHYAGLGDPARRVGGDLLRESEVQDLHIVVQSAPASQEDVGGFDGPTKVGVLALSILTNFGPVSSLGDSEGCFSAIIS